MKAERALRRMPAWAACLVAVLVAAAGGEQPKAEPGMQKGFLNELAGPVGGLVRLGWKGQALRLDRQHWEGDLAGKGPQERLKAIEADLVKNRNMPKEWAAKQAQRLLNAWPAERAFEKLRTKAGCTSSSSSTGGQFRRRRFSGRGLAAEMRVSGDDLVLKIEEEGAPFRSVELRDNGHGVLRLLVTDAKGSFLLVVNQSANGRLSVAHVAGEKVFARAAESFQAFHDRNRPYVAGRLFPLLRRVGVIVPWTRHDAKVKAVVLTRLSAAADPEQVALGRKLIKELDDDSFQKREQATKALSKDFARYRSLIEKATAGASPEAEGRLARIMAENRDQDGVGRFVTERRLTEDVGYLIHLMEGAERRDREAIARKLGKLTGQKLGPDPVAWKKWRSENPAAGGG